MVLELGPRDVAAGNVVLKRRDTGTKEIIPQTELVAKVAETLEAMQRDMYAKAKQRLADNTVVANSLAEVREILDAEDTPPDPRVAEVDRVLAFFNKKGKAEFVKRIDFPAAP